MNKEQDFYYVTTPIYYVNDKPHIGHFYTTLIADVLSRFKRLDGYKVLFLTGTDEHGQKIQKKAKELNTSPQDFVDSLYTTFKDLSKVMNFSNDDFIRTTEERHMSVVKEVWQKLYDKGLIYKGKYSGWYSVADEAFYAEDEIFEDSITKVKKSKITGAVVEKIEEESYFFKLSSFQEKLLKFYEENKDFIKPKSRYNEVVSFVKGGLSDLSISRVSFDWGIKVPGDEKHVIYVWLDALCNYISALEYSPNKISEKFKTFWPASLHILGKDILRFHAVYWPAFLMGLELEQPKRIMSHGWWTNEGQKISKSLGNVIDPLLLVEKFGLDQVRYFFLKELPIGGDGNYQESSLINKINNELANDLGNLCQRTLSIVSKNFNHQISNKNLLKEQEEIITKTKNIFPILRKNIDDVDIFNYIEEVWKIIRFLNSFINEKAPWTLIKENRLDEAESILYTIVDCLKYIALYLHPVIPNSCDEILSQIGLGEKIGKLNYNNIFEPISSYQTLTPAVIFHKYVIINKN